MEGCPAKAKPLGRLREIFMFCNWKSKVAILQEGPEPLPRCDKCGMQIQEAKLFKHCQSDKCHESTERRLRRRDVEILTFNLDEEEGEDIMENVRTFQYLGQPIDQMDDDWPAVRRNIMRAR